MTMPPAPADTRIIWPQGPNVSSNTIHWKKQQFNFVVLNHPRQEKKEYFYTGTRGFVGDLQQCHKTIRDMLIVKAIKWSLFFNLYTFFVSLLC